MSKKSIIMHALREYAPLTSGEIYQRTNALTGQNKNAQSVTLAELKKAGLIDRNTRHQYYLTSQGNDWCTANPGKPKATAFVESATKEPPPGIKPTILSIMAENTPLNFAELWEETHTHTGHIERSQLSKRLNAFKNDGLIILNRNARYELTEAGEEYVSNLQVDPKHKTASSSKNIDSDKEKQANDIPEKNGITDNPGYSTRKEILKQHDEEFGTSLASTVDGDIKDEHSALGDPIHPKASQLKRTKTVAIGDKSITETIELMPDKETRDKLQQIISRAQDQLDAIATETAPTLSLPLTLIKIRNAAQELLS